MKCLTEVLGESPMETSDMKSQKKKIHTNCADNTN